MGTAPADSQSTPKNGDQIRESCVKYFDAIWFCYTPVHQVQEYYRYGKADDCFAHWSKLFACLKQRTKFAEQVHHSPLDGKHPLWTLRSKDEAAEFWQANFPGEKAEGSNDVAVESDSPRDDITMAADHTSKKAVV